MPEVRDPFGLVPHYRNNRSARTSSCLHDLLDTSSTANTDTLLEWVLHGDVWHESTFFEDIVRIVPRFEAPATQLVDRDGRELVELFWRTLSDAVKRSVSSVSGELVVALSGGLDAAALATALVESRSHEVRAVTVGRPGDDETLAAQMTADGLGIELTVVEPSSEIVDWPDHALWPTLPRTETDIRWEQETVAATVVWGIGGDSLLRGDRRHYMSRIQQGQWGAAVADITRSVILHGCKPALGLRAAVTRHHHPPIPGWLAPDLRASAASIGRRRLEQVRFRRGVDEMWAPAFQWFFQWMAPQHNQPAIDHRFPYFDRPLVDLMATVPTAPWCVSKNLLRAALRGRIPEPVRQRPKSPATTPSKLRWDNDFAHELRDRLACSEHVGAHVTPPCAGEFLRSDVEPLLRCAAAAHWRERLTAPSSSRIVAAEIR